MDNATKEWTLPQLVQLYGGLGKLARDAGGTYSTWRRVVLGEHDELPLRRLQRMQGLCGWRHVPDAPCALTEWARLWRQARRAHLAGLEERKQRQAGARGRR